MPAAKTEVRGDVLAQARRLRSLKQAELADLVGIPRSRISSLESTEATTVDDVLRLALEDALSCPRGYLLRDAVVGPKGDHMHYRKKARVPKRDQERLSDIGGLMVRLVDLIETNCRLAPAVDIPTMRYDPEVDAETVRRCLGLPVDTPLVSMTRVIEKQGAFVGRFEGDVGVDGFSWRSGERALVMYLGDGSSSRQRWSLAHELGHLVYRHVGQSDEIEEEAHAFAGAFLLPRAAMWREFPSHRSTIDWVELRAMKRRWGTSLAAILRRARRLNLIDAAQYHRSFQRLGQMGWRKEEPDEPPYELPSLLPRALVAIAQAKRWTPMEMAQHAAVPVDFATQISAASLPEPEPAEVVSLGLARHRRDQP